MALDGRLRGAEKIGEFGRGLIIQLDVSDGTGMRREEGTGRAKSMLVTLVGYCICSTTVPCSTRFFVVAPSDEKTVIG